jgi:hypothetical protein
MILTFLTCLFTRFSALQKRLRIKGQAHYRASGLPMRPFLCLKYREIFGAINVKIIPRTYLNTTEGEA